MTSITSFSDVQDLEGNSIFADGKKSFMQNSTITFNGTGNILFVEDGVTLARTTIRFCGNNCVIYLKSSPRVYCLQVDVYNNSTVYIGSDNYFNGPLHISVSEEKNVIIGDEGLFSFDIWIRTADPHLIYSCDTHERINPSRSVFIGDHVWFGQSSIILKGSVIGSGSIIGAGSIVTGKKVPSNVSFSGNPAKLIKTGVFFSGECVHAWTEETAKEGNVFESDCYIYSDDENILPISDIDYNLTHCDNADERLSIIKSTFAKEGNKNRFFVPLPKEKPAEVEVKKKGFFFK